jgi:hypothetical protein
MTRWTANTVLLHATTNTTLVDDEGHVSATRGQGLSALGDGVLKSLFLLRDLDRQVAPPGTSRLQRGVLHRERSQLGDVGLEQATQVEVAGGERGVDDTFESGDVVRQVGSTEAFAQAIKTVVVGVGVVVVVVV